MQSRNLIQIKEYVFIWNDRVFSYVETNVYQLTLFYWICEILTLVDLQLGGQKARVYFRICVNWIDLLQMERDYWMKYITIVGIGVVKIRYSFHLIQRVN